MNPAHEITVAAKIRPRSSETQSNCDQFLAKRYETYSCELQLALVAQNRELSLVPERILSRKSEHLHRLSLHRTSMSISQIALAALISCMGTPALAASQSMCSDRAITAVQVLGSGGPMHGGGRGSASYLLWYRGRPSILIDGGAGTSVALARIGVDETALTTILITHLHPDHVSDLPDLIWSMSVRNRNSSLLVAGPTGSGEFPGIRTFLTRLFGPQGAFPYMNDVLDLQGFALHIDEVDATGGHGSKMVLQDGDLTVLAYPVEHGRSPTLAYRVNGPDFSVVFGADQTARNPGFARFAAGADLLILHAILNPKGEDSDLAQVVALPEDLAETAAEAKPKHVLLGHLMLQPAPGGNREIWSLADTSSVTAAIRVRYHGTFELASDLACYTLSGSR
jgi:ribonuclease Z